MVTYCILFYQVVKDTIVSIYNFLYFLLFPLKYELPWYARNFCTLMTIKLTINTAGASIQMSIRIVGRQLAVG